MSETNALQATLRRLTILTVIVYVVLALLGAFVWLSGTSQRNEIRRVAAQTSTALCSLRHDLELRVAASRRFLKAHPHGTQDFSRADIKLGIDNQQRTIDALRILNCPAPLTRAVLGG